MTIIETSVKIQKKSKTTFHENFLANASVTFKLEEGGHFTISGFAVWKSQFDPKDINVTPPGSRTYKYALFEDLIWTKLKKEIVDEYDRDSIPIIEVTNSKPPLPATKSNYY